MLRYFTYDLFLAQNNEYMSPKEEEVVQERWNQHMLEYRSSYKQLAERLPQDVFHHFAGWGFHDYQLLSFELDHKSLREMNLKLTLNSDDGMENSILLFKDVSWFEYHHENYYNKKSVMNRDQDVWLYEEFLTFDPYTLSFEVIFSSGASIAIKFPNNCVSIIKEKK